MTLTGWSGLTAGQILYPSDATTLTSSPSFLWGADITAGKGLTLAAGTATTDVNALSVTQTWNNAAVAFVGAKIVITDTASAAGSLALQILGGAAGATKILEVRKDGHSGFGNTSLASMVNIANQQYLGFELVSGGTAVFMRSTSGDAGEILTSGYATAFSIDASVLNLNVTSGTAVRTGGILQLGGIDTAISRISAGLIGVGTGAAGSFAGALKYAYTIAAASANNRMTNQKLLYGATTDAATAVELTTDGAAGSGATNRILVPADTTLSCVVNIAVKQSASASAKQMLRQFVISNNGGTTAIQGTVVTLGTDSGTAGLATVTCTITANDTDDAVKIEVNGVLATNLRYTAYVVSTEVLYA